MIALLLAAAILAGGQGPARVPDREAHVIAMRALARAAIERDPEFNRAGQEALRRAVQVSGDQRERRLNDVTATHSDAWFENGVQVGAQARAMLATHLAGLDRYDEAERIATEMVRLYPGAIDETCRQRRRLG